MSDEPGTDIVLARDAPGAEPAAGERGLVANESAASRTALECGGTPW